MKTINQSPERISAQTVPAEMDFDQAHDVAGQLQASVLRFAQEDDGYQQSLLTVVTQLGAQLRAADATAQRDRAEIEKLASRISNYRS